MAAAKPRVLITGAAKRIGQSLAQTLKAGGCIVWGHTRREADLATPDGPEILWRNVIAAIGAPEIIIHNAASFRRDDTDAHARAQNFAVNVEAPRRLNALLSSKAQGTVITLLDGTLDDLPPALTSYKESAVARAADVAAQAAQYRHLKIHGLRLGYVLRAERQSEAHWQECLTRRQRGKPIALEAIRKAVLDCLAGRFPSGTILDLLDPDAQP